MWDEWTCISRENVVDVDSSFDSTPESEPPIFVKDGLIAYDICLWVNMSKQNMDILCTSICLD